MFRQASDREAVYACFTFSHWLVYANSAANPIIYNFLSGERAGEAGVWVGRGAAVFGTTVCTPQARLNKGMAGGDVPAPAWGS